MAAAPQPDAAAIAADYLDAQRSAAHRRAAELEREIVRATFKPPARLGVTAWADEYRYLSPESSAEPGKYSSDRTPYAREIMDAISDPHVRRVVAMLASQLGKTELVNNAIGRNMHLAPGPMLVLQPTLDMAETWSKDRLAPMLRDTPALARLVAAARSRDSGNTLLHKSFPGGHLTIVGANSAAGLASRPIRDVICDEVDRYPASAGTEGDPIGLAARRTTTFGNSKLVLISTPTIKGFSRIEKAYEQSDQRKYFVPCPHCGHEQILVWGGRDCDFGLKWTYDDRGELVPEGVVYLCEGERRCVIDEMHKPAMVRAGRWVALNPGHPTPGFWANALISLFDGARWAKLVAEFLEVKKDAIRLRAFCNTVWCETWEDEGQSLDTSTLGVRREPYPCECPPGEHEPLACTTPRVPARAAVLTRSVDVQGDRLETAVWAWGAGEEAWLVEHELIAGDPATEGPWRELDEIRRRTYRHEHGVELRPAVTFVDSGGHHAKEVYAYTRARVGQKVFAIKGASTEGAPLLSRPTRNNSAKAILYLVGVFSAKESIMARYARIQNPGPGYGHLPDWLADDAVAQLTAEKLVTKFVGGRPKRAWVKESGRRNELLDLNVYALAALHFLGPKTIAQLGAIAAKLAARGAALPPPPAAKAPDPAAPEGDDDALPPSPPPPTPRQLPQRFPRPPRGGGGFVGGWRR